MCVFVFITVQFWCVCLDQKMLELTSCGWVESGVWLKGLCERADRAKWVMGGGGKIAIMDEGGGKTIVVDVVVSLLSPSIHR